jgi:hypothetical protein
MLPMVILSVVLHAVSNIAFEQKLEEEPQQKGNLTHLVLII